MAAASKFKMIGCRLPHGLVIAHPLEPSKKATIEGMNKSRIIGATHIVTPVDAEVWDMFVAQNPKFPALKNKAIFEANNVDDAAAIAKEFANVKTGFEPKSQDKDGVTKA